MTPSGRCLLHARNMGWLADVVERRITKILTKDLFGCIDLVALDGQPGLLGIQATSRQKVRARLKKIQTECWPSAERWLGAGNRLEVWGWGKLRGRRGGRPTWRLNQLVVTLDGAYDPSQPLEGRRWIDFRADESAA